MFQIPVSHSGSLKDCHFFTTGAGSASGQQYRIDTSRSPPLLHLRLIKFGQISHGKKKFQGEQNRVVEQSADCGEAAGRAFAASGRGAAPKNGNSTNKREFMGGWGGEWPEKGENRERE